MEILAKLCQTTLQCGKHQEAKIFAETVLKEVENVKLFQKNYIDNVGTKKCESYAN